jgi:hypothetical protein
MQKAIQIIQPIMLTAGFVLTGIILILVEFWAAKL